MSQYSTDSLARSSRTNRSMGASLGASRPFLNLLNPMGRNYRGYQRPEEHLMEEDEDEEDEEEAALNQTSVDNGDNGASRRVSWGNPSEARTEDAQELTEPEDDEDDDEVPQSFLIEATPRRRTSRRGSATRGLKLTPLSPTAQRQGAASGPNIPLPQFSVPPRPSEIDAPAVASQDLSPGTAFATTRPKQGLDDYEKALWNWVNVYNLDAYLQEVYVYYVEGGIFCIALSRGLNLLTVGFVITFSTFLLGCVNYSSVSMDGTGRLSDIVVDHCISRFSGFTRLFFYCFGAFFAVQIIEFVRGVMRLSDMYKFYTHLLGIPDGDIQTIAWPEVVRRIGQIRDQNPGTAAISSAANNLDASAMHHSNSPPTATLDAHDVANRIMRQENYLIALFNKELLDLRVPLPALIERLFGRQQEQGNTLTRALEWNLRYCLLGHLFDNSGRVRKVFLKEKNRAKLVEQLRRRFIFMGVLNAIFAPFIVLYLLMYSFFRYFEEYHKNPSSIGGRQYTPYAQWKFREFNELPHIFRRRLDESYPVAGEYLDQFPKRKVALIMRFVAFVAGSFAAVLVLATIWDPDIFVHFEITPHRTVLFYLGVCGSVMAVARGMVPDAHHVFDPELLMREVISHTHYMPAEWKGLLHSEMVQKDFGRLFDMKVSIFVAELASVVLTPFVLWYSLPNCAPAIIDFFREFSLHVEGLGYVCSFAVFDFKRHGNLQLGASTDVNDERTRSGQGKMEMSMLNFKAANPDWNPADPAGSAFLSRLAELHQNESPSIVARAHGPLTRLRSNRSRSGRSFFAPGGGGYGASPFGYQDQPSGAPAAPAGGPSLREMRLADRAQEYERALQRSMHASVARKRGAASAAAGGSNAPSTGMDKGKAPEQALLALGLQQSVATATQAQEEQDHSDDNEVRSELGESYVHGTRTRGFRESNEDEAAEDEELDGGVMNLLGQIYSNQRRTVG